MNYSGKSLFYQREINSLSLKVEITKQKLVFNEQTNLVLLPLFLMCSIFATGGDDLSRKKF